LGGDQSPVSDFFARVSKSAPPHEPRANNGRDLVGIGGHDDLIGHSEIENALPDTDYEGCSANEAKRLSREP